MMSNLVLPRSVFFLFLCCPCVLQLKQMEVQLEEEYEDKQKVLRDKRELECKLLNTQEQVTSLRSPVSLFWRRC